MRLPAAPGQLVDIGTHRLHLQCTGSGPPVLFDSALGGSSLSWVYVQREVARFATACAYDRAGFGWSDPGPLPRTIGRIADELHALVAAARIAPPYVIVGHSFGGLTARMYAHRYPSEVRGLVLLDSAYPEDWLEPSDTHRTLIRRGASLCRYGQRAARFRLADAVDVLVRLGAIEVARRFARLVSAGTLQQADEEVLAPVVRLPKELQSVARRMWTQPRFFEALGSQIESICESAAELPVDQDFGDLPLTVISGERNSDAGQLSRQARLAARSRRGRHILAVGSGHWIPLERPDLVIEAVRGVIDLAREPMPPS